MGLDNAFTDSQSEARTGWMFRYWLSLHDAVKFVKEALKIFFRDTRAAISDANDYVISRKRGAYIQRRMWWRVTQGVFKNVGQYLIDLHVIQFNNAKVIGDIDMQRSCL